MSTLNEKAHQEIASKVNHLEERHTLFKKICEEQLTGEDAFKYPKRKIKNVEPATTEPGEQDCRWTWNTLAFFEWDSLRTQWLLHRYVV